MSKQDSNDETETATPLHESMPRQELAAMSTCWEAIALLPVHARARVLRWLNAQVDSEAAQP